MTPAGCPHSDIWGSRPCLLYTSPRLPSLKTARKVADRPIHVLGLDSFLDTTPNHYGLTGSPTQVERIFPPGNDTTHEIWTGTNLAQRLLSLLKRWKFI